MTPDSKPDLERDTKTSDYWVIAIMVCSAALVLVAVLSQFFDWHWLYNLWFNYSWSSDKGNGPEALQQTVVYAVAAALFIPVVRKFIVKHVADIKHSIHIHGTEITAHLHHITEQQGIPRFEHSDEYKAHVAEHEEPK
jgi:hypothetical protein